MFARNGWMPFHLSHELSHVGHRDGLATLSELIQGHRLAVLHKIDQIFAIKEDPHFVQIVIWEGK